MRQRDLLSKLPRWRWRPRFPGSPGRLAVEVPRATGRLPGEHISLSAAGWAAILGCAMPDWNDPRYFAAISREGGLAGASHALKVDAATVVGCGSCLPVLAARQGKARTS